MAIKKHGVIIESAARRQCRISRDRDGRGLVYVLSNLSQGLHAQRHERGADPYFCVTSAVVRAAKAPIFQAESSRAPIEPRGRLISRRRAFRRNNHEAVLLSGDC